MSYESHILKGLFDVTTARELTSKDLLQNALAKLARRLATLLVDEA